MSREPAHADNIRARVSEIPSFGGDRRIVSSESHHNAAKMANDVTRAFAEAITTTPGIKQEMAAHYMAVYNRHMYKLPERPTNEMVIPDLPDDLRTISHRLCETKKELLKQQPLLITAFDAAEKKLGRGQSR